MAEMDELLTVTTQDLVNVGSVRPVTGGVPVAQGAAPEGSSFALRDQGGNAVPLQTSILARWPDGSARWVLLDFLSQPEMGGKCVYTLLVDKGGTEGSIEEGVVETDTDYGPGVGWPEDRHTTHWLENNGTTPAVEISVDIVEAGPAHPQRRGE